MYRVKFGLVPTNSISLFVTTAIKGILPQLVRSFQAEEQLTKTIGDLRTTLQSQSFEIDRLAQYGRRENVRLHGVPETANDDTDEAVIGIAHDMGVEIDRKDISASHRLPKSRSMPERPIIVKLSRRNTKTAIMINKKTLRTIDRYRHIYVNDDLPPPPPCAAACFACCTTTMTSSVFGRSTQLPLRHQRGQRGSEEEV